MNFLTMQKLSCTLGCLMASFQALAAPLVSTEQVALSQGLLRPSSALVRRDALMQALIDRGVAPAQAGARVAALTQDQAQQLAHQLEQAPAGASAVVGTVILIGAVLVFTDILGYTHLFPVLHKE
jgi:hypothetical protein